MFDCVDPVRVASFWQQLLPIEERNETGPYVFLQPADGVGLGFQRVESPTAGKNRVHLDLQTDDVASAVDRVLELGGTRVEGYEDGGFLVVADPERNEFCILPNDGAHLDREGIAHYQPSDEPASTDV
jgi:predicted enzyme related to lactoylglutathione lyase